MNFDTRAEMDMENLPISRVFTLIEPGPVVLVTTNDGQKDNVMTISWTMVLDFAAEFAITTGPWNYSYTALQESKECVISIPTVDLIDTVVGECIAMVGFQLFSRLKQFTARQAGD